MSTDREHEDIANLLGAFALHSVESDEDALVRAHLDECPRCRSELDELEEIAAALATFHVEEPPADLWPEIARRTAASHRRLNAVASTEERSGPAPLRPSTLDLGQRPSEQRPPGRRTVLALTAAALAAAAVIAGLALSLSSADNRNGQLQSALAERGQLSALSSALASPGHRVIELRSNAGTRLVEVVLRSDGNGYVMASALAPLPGDETYQLWASIDGQPISLGLLGERPHAGGAFSLRTGAQPSALMITIEPAGGVITPDRTPVATGSVT
jgi:anti-sigma-K factor RskA